MVHAAVVMDDENSIIIVGERQAMDLGEILKILVNIEAEYWNRIWIDFENVVIVEPKLYDYVFGCF